MTDIARTILEVFRAVEERDEEAFVRLCRADVTFHWPASLPYGGSADPAAEVDPRRARADSRPTWKDTWDRLQPTRAERSMKPRIVSSRGDEVVVHWHQRGVDSHGGRLDEEVLGLYQVRDGKLARAQMFYFDTALVSAFLAQAQDHQSR